MGKFDRLYYHRLRNDIASWQAQGLVDARTADVLMQQTQHPASGSQGAGFAVMLFRLGLFLLLASAFSFVAANWGDMSKLTRLVLLTGLMWAALGAGWWAGLKEHKSLKEALLVCATGLFGLNIILIAQMYHIDRHFPDGYWLAGVGALVVAGLMRAKATLLLGWVLLAFWSASEIIIFDAAPHWEYIPFWLLAMAVTYGLAFSTGLIVGILSAILWLVSVHFYLLEQAHASLISAIAATTLLALTLIALSVAIMRWEHGEFGDRMGSVLFVFSLVSFFFILGGMQFEHLVFHRHAGAGTWWVLLYGLVLAGTATALALWSFRQTRNGHIKYLLLPALAGLWCLLILLAEWLQIHALLYLLLSVWFTRLMFLMLSLWAIYLGQSWKIRWLVYLGLTAFALEICVIYIRLFGSLLDTSLFFFLSGLLLLAGGYGMEKWRKKLLDS